MITIDFETYYSKDFSLARIGIEEYVRSPQFEVIGVAVKVDTAQTVWFSGTHEETAQWLGQFDWANEEVLAHNTMFDGAILTWCFGITPKRWLDTKCIAKALFPAHTRADLASIATKLRLGVKGTEVVNALGMRRASFAPDALRRYAEYCINDVDLTYAIYMRLKDYLPAEEYDLIDVTLRMFTQPVFVLDKPLLQELHHAELVRKDELMRQAGVTREGLLSNPKFAALLESIGVPCPTKVSSTTGKVTHALAKTDEGFKALLNHPNDDVRILAEARLGVKSTINETRAARLIGISERGALPVPLTYYGTHTGRWSGTGGKINMQNLPARGSTGLTIKHAITAPDGYTIIDADSSQIEARVLAWLAGQDDLVQMFRDMAIDKSKYDVYKQMASAIYQVPVASIDKTQRFIGKSAVLGCGYGVGAQRFSEQFSTPAVRITLEEAEKIVTTYRSTYPQIVELWRVAGEAVKAMMSGEGRTFGRGGVMRTAANRIILPNGLSLHYPELQAKPNEQNRVEFSYRVRNGRTRLYGAKLIENICQALARIIIGYQILLISERYRVVLTVHDAIAVCVPDGEVSAATEYVEHCMKQTPAWAVGMPITCESGSGKRYGDC